MNGTRMAKIFGLYCKANNILSIRAQEEIDLRTLFPPAIFGGFTDLSWTITKYEPNLIEATLTTPESKRNIRIKKGQDRFYFNIIVPGNQFLAPEYDREIVPFTEINDKLPELINKINQITLQLQQEQPEYFNLIPQDAFNGWNIVSQYDEEDQGFSDNLRAIITPFGTNFPSHFSAEVNIDGPPNFYAYIRWNRFFAPEINNLANDRTEHGVSYRGKNPQIITTIMKTLGQKVQQKILTSSLSIREAAEYIEKKKEESGNITYIYSDKHIKKRNKKKAQKILKLHKSIEKLRKQLKEDLKDPTKSETALVISLIDDTYERVGNPASATQDHFGVTTWRKKHVSFENGHAIIKYKGKAGVDQKKKISKRLSGPIKTIIKTLKPNDELFPNTSQKDVSNYLKPFKITGKDIRGYHANFEMKKALEKAHKSSSKDEKARKEEFKKALEETAEQVGHNTSTLKNQYLIPTLETNFLEKGKIEVKAAQIGKPHVS